MQPHLWLLVLQACLRNTLTPDLEVDKECTGLYLVFSKSGFKDVVEVSEALHKHQSTAITNLLLYFDRCEQLSDLSALAAAVTTLTGLKELHLYFDSCEQLSDLSALAAAVTTLTGLNELHLDFQGCDKLPQHLQTRFTSRSEFLEVTCAKAILPICRIPFYSGFWCCRLV